MLTERTPPTHVDACQFTGGQPLGVEIRNDSTVTGRMLRLSFWAARSAQSVTYEFDCQLPAAFGSVSAFGSRQFLQVYQAPVITSVIPGDGEQGTVFEVTVAGSFDSVDPVQLCPFGQHA